MDAVTGPPTPRNEPVLDYAPGSPEAAAVAAALSQLAGRRTELTMTIGGDRMLGAGEPIDVVAPHRHGHVVGTMGNATAPDVRRAVSAAVEAAPAWRALGPDERAAVMLRAADLLTGPWRARMNAATMLGQSKSVYQSEIDAACELADFFRFNVHFARNIMAEQPQSTAGTWNRFDHRPLEGFVLAITPFNFTSIAVNLPTAPALMGVPVVWKPSPTQQLAAHEAMLLLEAAGLPPGVINLVTGDGSAVSEVAVPSPDLAGIHFTGSTATFRRLWSTVGASLGNYRNYPRLVGETGGKDFVIAHPSADSVSLAVAMVRGAFEYQGQKCSAASRAYLPRSLWEGGLRDLLVSSTGALRYGDIADFGNFGGAVIDRHAFAKHAAALRRFAGDPACDVLAGGSADDSVGYFVQPTVVTCTDPEHEIFSTEYFGPILGVYVYDDGDFETVVRQAAGVAPYALTGAVFARDRSAIAWASEELRYSAGNFYVNDKPTGAVVGQQPFGGARASGTNDKAGSPLNLLRWVSPRTIKETFVPATRHRYPHQG
ncbi:MAG: L-glutamate gamma-semialdehyde dehydrogenase [Mycobacteriales bacterium]